MAGVYIVVLSIFAVHRWNILTFDGDTGIFAQVILNAAHGFRNAPEGGSHFQFHFSPIVAVLYPLVADTHSALVLQFAQIVLIGLVAPATYLLFRPYLSPRVCTSLAFVSLFYAPIAAVGETEFHELAFFPLLLTMLVWGADRERWGWFATFGACCVLVKEDVGLELGLVAFAIAVVVWLRRDSSLREGLLFGVPRSPGAVAAAFLSLGLAAVIVVAGYFASTRAVFGSLVPDVFSGHRLTGPGWETGQEYEYPFAHGAFALVAALLLHPSIALRGIYNFDKVGYLLQALLPLMLLPLRSWWALAAVPSLVSLLLASNPYLWSMGRHYSANWAPWLIIATGVALAHLERKAGQLVAQRWAYAAIAGCVVVLAAFNPMHLGFYLRPFYADVASAHAALNCVPRGASVSTHKEWFATVAALNPDSTFNATGGVQYLVYASDYQDFFQRWTLPALEQSVRAGRYVEICRFGNVMTYRRIGPHSVTFAATGRKGG
jgi:uncharacterized membrane protein